MAVVLETSIKRFIGLSSDTKPTGVPVASTFLEYDTDAIYVTYDGTNWVLKGLTPGVGAANLGKAEDAAHATGDTGVMLLAVRQDAAAALATTDADYIPLIVNASGKLWTQSSIDQTTDGTTNRVNSKPFSPILELGLTEIIDKDDTEVSTSDYSKSVSAALGATMSGRIKQISLYATELGTGAVRANSGYLLIFDTDPTVSAGDTALALADWQSCIAKVLVSDWISDTGGGIATMEVDISFHALATLYFVFRNDGTAFNDAAGDDEELHVNGWFERYS